MVVERWRQTIIKLESQHKYENPFLNVSIQATFKGPSGRIIRREAYWDGGNSYCISFAPTEVGMWKWSITAPQETGLNHNIGELECIPYKGTLDIYKHGFLKVAPSGRYLVYEDETPFFWLGDTHWEFAHGEKWDKSNHPKMSSMFRGMADLRAKQGYSVYQTNLRSDALMGGESYYWMESSKGDIPNVTFYQKELDRRMYYLADLGLVNALGFAWFMSIENAVEHEKNLARYIIARYGALPIVWTLAGEVAGYSAEKREEYINGWREVALYIESKDDYQNLQTAHYTNERPFADYYQEEEWYDFTLNQAGHGDYPISVNDYRDFMQKHATKPFIEGEVLYEFCSTLEENGTRLCTDDMLRRVAYMSIQLGGCGFTYGAQGIWDNVWEKGSNNPMKLFNRFDITWYEAIDGPGGREMGDMRKFYERVHFWEQKPYGLDEKDDNLFGKKMPLITINQDHNRLVLYYGDTARKNCIVKGLENGEYVMTWFNPKNGSYSEIEESIVVEENAWRTVPKPEMGDWLLILEAKTI